MSLISKFKDMFFDFEPDSDDHYIIDKWKKETEEADRLKELHRQSRKQTEKSKLKKGLKLEDFERAKQTNKQKNKTLSSNF
tara:strand:+ start:26 stop:268 length:243 start_codon:yes stop_codon:yes gene_type:complete